MKIAIFFNLPSGGAKRALFEQVKRLTRHHQVDIYTLSTANHDFCDLRKLVKNYFISDFNYQNIFPFNLLSVYFQLPKIENKIATDIDQRGYDVVLVCHDLFTQAPLLLRYLKTPSVYFCQEPKREFYETIPRVEKKISYFLTYPFRLPIKYIDRANILAAKLVLVNSVYSQNLIKNIYGVKSEVNYLGVDTDLFHRLPNVKKENIILSVGGFNLLKGHDFIIKTLSLFSKDKRPELIIVGNGGEDKKYLKCLANDLEVRVKHVENVSDRELLRWYNKAKIFVYAPILEPFGLATLEAAACGLPIVAVNEGGAPEVLKNIKSAILINRNEKNVSKKITQLLSEQLNYSIITKDIQNIKQNYNWKNSTTELEKYLLHVSKP